MTRALARFNALPAVEAAQRLLRCCAVRRWAEQLSAGRPYDDVVDLLAAADAVFASLTDAEVLEAAAVTRPVLEVPHGSGPSGDTAARAAFRAGIAAYEDRFGHSFVVAASGVAPGQLLHALQVRMLNDPGTERTVAREELRRITRLRLEEQFLP